MAGAPENNKNARKGEVNKNANLNVRVYESDLKKWKSEAKALCKTLSDYVTDRMNGKSN